MKGIVLAGGLGTRLAPLTLATNKHLLPVYDVPMIFYPIRTLVSAGITDIMIVVSGPHSGDFISVLKNGEDLGCRLYYGYQEKPDGGIADALSICREFCINPLGQPDRMCVILGDNTTDYNIRPAITLFSLSDVTVHAHLFLKTVHDPQRFGVAKIHPPLVTNIEEKPTEPASCLAVTGLYLFDENVWRFIDECSPSDRGELEITDVNNKYIKHGEVTYDIMNGFWKDAGTFESLLEAGNYWRSRGGYHNSGNG